MRIGKVDIEMLSDGDFRLDGGAVFGVVPKVLWERVVQPDALNRVKLTLGCLLIRSEGRNILIETGFGSKVTERDIRNFAIERTEGLLGDLRQAGLAPEDIDIVINTHLHNDHAGGNTCYRNGKLAPTFPRARYLMQRGEWQLALHPNERTRATYLAENLLALDEAGVASLLDGDAEVTPEVRCELAPGHTPFHQVVHVQSEGEHAVCLGDLAQLPVHLERLAWVSAFDLEPLVTMESKRRLLRQAAEQHSTVFLIHHPHYGHVFEEGGAFRFEMEA